MINKINMRKDNITLTCGRKCGNQRNGRYLDVDNFLVRLKK